MKKRVSWKTIALVVGAGAVGYLVGPPIAAAAGSLVTIEGSGTTHKALVTSGGRLEIDTGGVTVQSQPHGCGQNGSLPCHALLVQSNGTFVDANGAGVLEDIATHTYSNCNGAVEAITVDNTSGSSATFTVSADLQGTGARTVIWTDTVPNNGHVNDTFGTGGVGFRSNTMSVSGLKVDEGAGTAQWFVYGGTFGC
jgi:hypothetical protein